MPRFPVPFRPAQLTRALKAAEKASRAVKEATIAPDGSIRLVFDLGTERGNLSALDKWEAENEDRNADKRRPSR